MVNIRKAVLLDLKDVKYITNRTIKEIYPHYYAKGAVDFVLQHHNEEQIKADILSEDVWLLEHKRIPVGTIAIKGYGDFLPYITKKKTLINMNG